MCCKKKKKYIVKFSAHIVALKANFSKQMMMLLDVLVLGLHCVNHVPLSEADTSFSRKHMLIV